MTAALLWGARQQWWTNELPVDFDGVARTITPHPGVTELRMKQDVYSAWKVWVKTEDNAKYLPALRSIGGDPIGGGLFAGDIYFLINGWQLVIPENTQIAVTGAVFHDDAIPVFDIQAGGGVTVTVSNLVQTATPSAEVIQESQQPILDHVRQINARTQNFP
jgi:hypothetical protein